MINASDRAWNSATTLYIARKLERIAAQNTSSLKVLDMGCGDGNLIEVFYEYGHDLYGYDFPRREESIKRRLQPIFGDAYGDHIHMMHDERRIPFDNDIFDVVYANQVFEHVRFLDAMASECARVLKPGGTLVALFPLVTCLVESHMGIPFAHWIPPGKSRMLYIQTCLSLKIGHRHSGMNAKDSATAWVHYLNENCFYREINEIVSSMAAHFESSELDTGDYITAKLDLLGANRSEMVRMGANLARRLPGSAVNAFVTHYRDAVFCMKNPHKERQSACGNHLSHVDRS